MALRRRPAATQQVQQVQQVQQPAAHLHHPVRIQQVAYASTAPKKASLYVATPCYGGYMSAGYLASLMCLKQECERRGHPMLVSFMGNESLVPRARNILTGQFMRSGADRLLFIDADISFSPDTVFRLVEAERDVATAVYAKKGVEWDVVEAKLRDGEATAAGGEPTHMMGMSYNINLEHGRHLTSNGFVKVLDAATGFMMVKREAMQRVIDAYAATLTCVNDLPGNREDPMYLKEYVAVFDCMIDPATRRYLSEDYAFSRRAQAVGIEVWADVMSSLLHEGTYMFEGDVRQRLAAVSECLG
jgi:hypothetical protein